MSPSPLTIGELDALLNLQRKQEGDGAPFINIRDARALTALGFATRSRDGWVLTAEGAARLSLEPAQTPVAPTLHALHTVLAARSSEGAPDGAGPAPLERWRYLRSLLQEQLAAFEAGRLQLLSEATDVSADAMADLRIGIAELDTVIARDDVAP